MTQQRETVMNKSLNFQKKTAKWPMTARGRTIMYQLFKNVKQKVTLKCGTNGPMTIILAQFSNYEEF